MIAIIDYGVGNLFSLASSLHALGLENEVTRDAAALRRADRILLPGVGAFGDAAEKLRATGLVPVIRELAGQGKPLLGICLGMQMLFDRSSEFGEHRGLGIIAGEVVRIPAADAGGARQRVPNVGWNPLFPRDAQRGFAGTVLRYFPAAGEVYFVHSYEAKPEKAVCELAYTRYGGRDVCAVAANEAGNAVGCQFHPEKSGEAGLSILRAFLEDCR